MSKPNLRVWGPNYLVDCQWEDYTDLLCGKVVQRGGNLGEHFIQNGKTILFKRQFSMGNGYAIVSAEDIVAVVLDKKGQDEDR